MISRFTVCSSITFFAVAVGAVSLARADDALTTLVAEIKRSGEPIELADFELHGIADADNAAIELRKAGDSIDTKSPAWTAYDFLKTIAAPITDAEAATFAELAKENAKSFEHLDLAMQRKSVDWQIKMTSPSTEILLPHLATQRQLARLLQTHALLRDHESADGDALKDIQRMIFVSRAVDQQGFVVGHLVSVNIMALTTSTCEMLTPTLKFGPAPAATMEQVKQTITMLLDDASTHRGQRTAVQMERMSDLDIVRNLVSGKTTAEEIAKVMAGPQGKAKALTITPDNARDDGVILLSWLGNEIRVIDASSDWPTLKSHLPKRPLEFDADPNSHPLGTMIAPQTDRFMLTSYRAITERHLAAAALAIRAYESAHDGKAPQTLADLVPEYFPQVPSDPMAVGQPVKYDAAKQIVYSIGENGVDDHGGEKPTGKSATRGRWQSLDVVTHLQPRPRP